MIKRILLPLDPSNYTETACDFAIMLAKLYNAEISGLVVLDIAGIKARTGPLPPGVGFYAKELEHTKIDIAKVHIRNLLSKYRNKVESMGVVFKEVNAQGSPSEQIPEFAKFYDIVISGLRNKYRFETSENIENSIDDVLESSITPIFAVPEDRSKFDEKDIYKVIIAYNDSHSSIRALRRFAQIEMPKNLDVKIFISTEDKEEARGLYEQAKDFLNSHGIMKVDSIITSKNKIEFFMGEVLEDTDIVVLGVHSKSGFFDFLFGSLAKHLISENKNLLFMCQ